MNSFEIEAIRRLINNRENNNVDFKLLVDFSRERNKKRLAQDVISFANAEGGTIIVGVEDKTRCPVGIPEPLHHDQIVQSITDLVEPPVDISVDTVDINGKLFGVIKIQRGKAVHRLCKGKTVYVRRDGKNDIATPKEITQFSDERDYSSRVYLSKPDRLFFSDNGATILSGETQPYRKAESIYQVFFR
jgi:predicted HTH transcriptional regulator